ncbi:hypothetical protein CHU92_09030 [Flavobacterium cyanobacteriorum]|uniref:Uncharacterized protein n=1 Tax=Flavobacterium cyanobacteriorum TaxID=2022802 RepID=A0A255Z6E1_9FLAO|nr:hypothetical protein [Flavobacterium cyanobacteriorum]OYQ37006.1 hypothetical protein CHU92_09030 [Flavobacterium cyanobacteriorum]
MDKVPKFNTENESLRDQGKGNGDTSGQETFHGNDYTGSDSLNDSRPDTPDDERNTLAANNDGNDDTDKYLAMEQPGVTYTRDTEPSNLSDELDYSDTKQQNTWDAEGGNGLYSDAFSQDDYLLTDNVDLDEDQNKSISSDDEDFEETNERYTS